MEKTQCIDNQGQNFQETSLIYSQRNFITCLPIRLGGFISQIYKGNFFIHIYALIHIFSSDNHITKTELTKRVSREYFTCKQLQTTIFSNRNRGPAVSMWKGMTRDEKM